MKVLYLTQTEVEWLLDMIQTEFCNVSEDDALQEPSCHYPDYATAYFIRKKLRAISKDVVSEI